MKEKWNFSTPQDGDLSSAVYWGMSDGDHLIVWATLPMKTNAYGLLVTRKRRWWEIWKR